MLEFNVLYIYLFCVPVLLSGSDDGGTEPLHQDQPGSGFRAPVSRRRPGHHLPAAAHRGHARPGGLVPLSTERERPPRAERHIYARPAHQLHRLLPLR